MAKLIFGDLKGAQKVLNVFDDHLTLKQMKNIRAFLSNSWLQGEKEIYFSDITSVQYKPSSSLLLGYIQFEVPGLSGSNFGSENSWTFDSEMEEEANKVYQYVRNRVREIKNPSASVAQQQLSPADEIRRYKELLDAEIITKEEFEAKKKQLLGL